MSCKHAVLLLALAGCGTTGHGTLYVEPSIKPSDAAGIRRVAIVPNRLPINLQDPEKWRLFNFELIKDEFVAHGVQVVDYPTAVSVFERSGLPVEDTRSSRDKYADLAQQLGVDAIVVPYYGTFSSADGALFISHHFISVGTFQIYLARSNDFFARCDVNGDYHYTTGFTTVFAVVGGIIAAVVPLLATSSSSNNANSTAGVAIAGAAVGIAFPLVGIIIDAGAGSGSSDSHWEKAFRAAIHEGLKPFFAAIGGGGGYYNPGSAMDLPPPPQAPRPYQPPQAYPPGGYPPPGYPQPPPPVYVPQAPAPLPPPPVIPPPAPATPPVTVAPPPVAAPPPPPPVTAPPPVAPPPAPPAEATQVKLQFVGADASIELACADAAMRAQFLIGGDKPGLEARVTVRGARAIVRITAPPRGVVFDGTFASTPADQLCHKLVEQLSKARSR